MGRRPAKLNIEVVFAEPTSDDIDRWVKVTQILLRAQERSLKQRQESEGVMTIDRRDTTTPASPVRFPLDAEALITDFCKVAALSGIPIDSADIQYEQLPSPHTPPKRLPSGKKGVYVFCSATRCLKVGKVGPKSAARFTRHHYFPRSSKSNLAKSLLLVCTGDGLTTVGNIELTPEFVRLNEITVGAWIQQNTCRHHFLLQSNAPSTLLNLLEAFLQCRLDPLFEGG